MSGGSLSYAYLKIDMLVEELQSELAEKSGNTPDDVKAIINGALNMFRGASGAAKDIEWYLSGDTGPNNIRALHKTWPLDADEIERLRAANAELVEALEAIGSLPEGFCVCPGFRDAEKIDADHVVECRHARAALAKNKGEKP